MAAREPVIADDGVQEVALTIARPLLTRCIEQVREDGLVSAFTVRDRRRAYLVAPDFYKRALTDRRMVEALLRATEELSPEQRDAVSDSLLKHLLALAES